LPSSSRACPLQVNACPLDSLMRTLLIRSTGPQPMPMRVSNSSALNPARIKVAAVRARDGCWRQICQLSPTEYIGLANNRLRVGFPELTSETANQRPGFLHLIGAKLGGVDNVSSQYSACFHIRLSKVMVSKSFALVQLNHMGNIEIDTGSHRASRSWEMIPVGPAPPERTPDSHAALNSGSIWRFAQ
jgi:hypothetical protein